MSATQYFYEKWNCTAVYKEGATTHNVEDYVITPTSKVVNTTNFKISKETADSFNLQAHNTKIMYVLMANQEVETEAPTAEEVKAPETVAPDSTQNNEVSTPDSTSGAETTTTTEP